MFDLIFIKFKYSQQLISSIFEFVFFIKNDFSKQKAKSIWAAHLWTPILFSQMWKINTINEKTSLCVYVILL